MCEEYRTTQVRCHDRVEVLGRKIEKIIDAILGLTGSMNLPVVAEGIEDAVTLRMLTAKGCELGQGYFFGRPVPPGQFLQDVTSRRAARSAAVAAPSE